MDEKHPVEPIDFNGISKMAGGWYHILYHRIYGMRTTSLVDALLLSAASSSADGQIYNLGGDEPTSLLDLARLMVEVHGTGSYRLVDFPEERKQIDIGDYYGDYTKIQTELGWQPEVSLRSGIARTLDFYRQHHEHYW